MLQCLCFHARCMHLLPNGHLIDLRTIAFSGQIFRMEERDGAWFIIDDDCVVRLLQQGDEIRYETWPEGQNARVERLFRCDVQVGELQKELSVDPYVAEAARVWRGLWLLRQDPWETTVSFIISANKHFTHIRQCCHAIAREFGRPLETPWGVYYIFPGWGRLAGLSHDALRRCKVGYRAPFISDAASWCTEHPNLLDDLEQVPTAQAVEELRKVKGIGDKIADCILLFAYGRDDVVPYDVWLRRICTDLYGLPQNASYEQLRAWHRQHFGPYAGWAQQWLFCHAREVYQRGNSLKDTWFTESSS